MKKYFSIVFCVIMLFSFAGCGQSEKTVASSSGNSQVSSTALSQASSSGSATSSVVSSQQPVATKAGLASFEEGSVSFMLPDTFHKLSESPVIYVSSEYPTVSDNFSLAITEKDPNFKQITKEAYKKVLENMFSSFDITEFESTTVSDCPAIKIGISCTLNGVSLKQLQYMVDADKTYSFTYTFSNGNLIDHADDCVKSISVKKAA